MDKREETRQSLIEHYRTYPKLQIGDILKFLYQSSFGCEHLISSLDTVTDYIAKEYNAIQGESKINIGIMDKNSEKAICAATP